MSEADRPRCPSCGVAVSPTATRCQDCGEELFEEERPRPRGPRRDREPPDLEATELLVPTGVSVPALIAPYLGLIGFCLPIVGLPFALLAVIMGTIGLLKRRRGPTYGSVTGIIRAVIGLVLGALGLLISTVLILFLISENMRRK